MSACASHKMLSQGNFLHFRRQTDTRDGDDDDDDDVVVTTFAMCWQWDELKVDDGVW